MRFSSQGARATSSSAPRSTVWRIAALVAVVGAVSAGPATAAGVGPATQELAILMHAQTALTAPRADASAVAQVTALRPLTGARTTLPVIGHRSAGGVAWLRVRLPGRPNGRTGWIRRQGTDATRTGWQLVVDLSARRVTAFLNGRPARVFSAVVGKPSTPTPTGAFFVEEVVKLGPHDVGAPYALALSARSSVLQEFDGGPGQIALHGLDNVGGTLGTAVSHGCVRLSTAAVTWLAARIGAGFPVTISN